MVNKKLLIAITAVIFMIGCCFLLNKTNGDNSKPVVEETVTVDTTIENFSEGQDMHVESILIDERQYEDENIEPTGTVIIGSDEGYLSNPDDTEIVSGGVEFDD